MKRGEMRNAIISVSSKEGLEKAGKFLIQNDFNIFGTSGTRMYLERNGIRCGSVDELTGNPEILGGRVKTLSAALSAGILAEDRDDEELKRYGYIPIDLVYVELYDFIGSFRKKIGDLVEFIDIGGVTMLRAAAKNFSRVITVPGGEAMEWVMSEMKEGEIPLVLRKKLAADTFRLTSLYDYAISEWMGADGKNFTTGGIETTKLRYGENPHQAARSYALYPPFYEVIKVGKEVSFNNIIDAWTAWELSFRIGRGSSTVVKHASPCGAAVGENSMEKAYSSDPISAYGGILAHNGVVNKGHASFLKDKFLELIIARDFEEDAIELLDKKKNIRLLRGKDDVYSVPDIRSAGNVLLVQEWNKKSNLKFEVKSGKATERTISDVNFGWEVVKSIKSNAIAIVQDGWLLASCGGQPNRVDAVKIALNRAEELKRIDENSLLVSDGFFPFADSIELIESRGIRNIAAPLGSIRDHDVLDYAEIKGLTFIEIKERAFRH